MSKEENAKLIDSLSAGSAAKHIEDPNSPKHTEFKSPEKSWKSYFPYEPRLDQEGIAEFVSKNIREKSQRHYSRSD